MRGQCPPHSEKWGRGHCRPCPPFSDATGSFISSLFLFLGPSLTEMKLFRTFLLVWIFFSGGVLNHILTRRRTFLLCWRRTLLLRGTNAFCVMVRPRREELITKTPVRNFSPGCVKALNHVIASAINLKARVSYTRTKYPNAMMPKGKCVHAIECRP